MTNNEILESFKKYLIEDGKGERTVISYVGDIKRFLKWLEKKKVTFKGKITRFYITSYKDHLVSQNYKINTINKKINSLNSFNYFLISEGLCSEKVVYPNKDKMKVARGSEGEVEVFTDDEVEKILFYIDNREMVSSRDKVAILILLYTGLRVSELVSLKIKDIDLLTLSLKVVGKGGKYREVPLKADVVEAIKEYLEEERKESKFVESEYLLLTQRAGKMDKDTVNKLLRKHGRNLEMVMKPHKFIASSGEQPSPSQRYRVPPDFCRNLLTR